MEPKYEEQFTAFVDFLGFMEVSTQADDATRLQVLDLLLSLSALSGEFDVQSTIQETGKTSRIKPAISTFSDHIVISYPLAPIYADAGIDERVVPFVVLNHFERLLTSIAAAALRIGFLIRGGATVGKLYHARGVVFGEALVEAYQVESHTSIYPRVVLSNALLSKRIWLENQPGVIRDKDGLYHFDYFKTLVFRAAPPGTDWETNVKSWFAAVVPVITGNMKNLQQKGKLNEFAKWSWFANQFRDSLTKVNPDLLKALGITLDAIPW